MMARIKSWAPIQRLFGKSAGRAKTTSQSPRRPRKRRGYTVVEVMMAMSVLSIGATGVVAMQKVTLLSNTNARDLATASAIAASWVERLHVDARTWTWDDPNGSSTIANTQYLNQGQDVWFIPAQGPASGHLSNVESSYDVKGLDDAASPAFCVNLRLTTLSDNPVIPCGGPPITGCCNEPNPPGGDGCPAVIKAEVRVYWLKLHNSTNASTSGALGGTFCDAGEIGTLETDAEGLPRYHFVYATTAILRTDS